MFKPGDIVKMKNRCIIRSWYTPESFQVVKIVSQNIFEVNINFKSNYDYYGNTIHTDFIEIDIPKNRKQKLKEICLNQEI